MFYLLALLIVSLAVSIMAFEHHFWSSHYVCLKCGRVKCSATHCFARLPVSLSVI